MKKVIHVLTDRNIGGAGRWLLYYLRHYDRTRFSVSVLLPEDSLLRPEVEKASVQVLTLPQMQDVSWDRNVLSGMKKLFCVEKPDIVHTHASLTARVAARWAGVPVILSSKHCMETPGNVGKRFLRRWIGKCFTTKIIAVSRAVAESLIAGGTDPRQVVTICNGIDCLPPPTEKEKKRLREQYGIDREHLWVGIAARLEPVKGVDIFLEMALRILQERQDVHFLVCGTGSQEAALKDLARPAGDSIRFAGFVPQVEQLISLMDLTVVSSRQEALCLSALESMGQGVAAVGVRTGGIPEVIREGRTGLLAPPEDPEALADCVEQLLQQPQQRRAFASAGRAMVQEEYSAAYMTRQIEQLYETESGTKERKNKNG